MSNVSKQPVVERKGRPWLTSARQAAVGLSVLGALALAPAAQGAAIFNAGTNFSLTIEVMDPLSVVDMIVDVSLGNATTASGVSNSTATSTATLNDGLGGAAVASSTSTSGVPSFDQAFIATTPIGSGAILDLSSQVFGSAGELGNSAGSSQNEIFLSLVNLGPTDSTVRLTWTLDQAATVATAVVGESATGGSEFTLTDTSFTFDIFQPVFVNAFDGGVDSSLTGPTSDSVEVTLAGLGSFDLVFGFVDAFGSGSGVVPEPTTIALLGIGLLGMGFSSRRRRRSTALIS